MKTFTAVRIVTIGAGSQLVLSAKQIALREGRVKILSERKGLVELLEPLQFKAGETFGYAGELSKELATALADPDELEAERAAERKRAELAGSAQAMQAALEEADRALEAADKTTEGVRVRALEALGRVQTAVAAATKELAEADQKRVAEAVAKVVNQELDALAGPGAADQAKPKRGFLARVLGK